MFKGETLWWVGRFNNMDRQAVFVVKVGRKWATLSNGHRIDLNTMVADGGDCSPPGICYESKEVYDQEIAVNAAWSALGRIIRDYTGKPKDLTLEKIAQAREILGI